MDTTKEGAPTEAPDEATTADDAPIAFDAPAEPDPTEALRAELEESRANMLRALAEAENVRRRAQRDVADARQYAVTAFARDLLNVADNFGRALSAIDDDAEMTPEIKNLLEGVRMTERELTSTLERHGVKIVSPEGERFDPNRHQAMFEVENPDVPTGTILQVVQAGAMIGERTLRPAMVGVSKGGPKPGETPAPAEEGDS
ncbi:MAG: nucleotide exchange factor GrpE [Pseudomonadota bacterium]